MNIQQIATKRVNFRLFGADLSFLGCDVTRSSLVDITNFSGKFAAAVFRVEQCRTVASSTLKKKAASFSETYQIIRLYFEKIQTYVNQQYVQCIDISEVVHPWVLLNSCHCTCVSTRMT